MIRSIVFHNKNKLKLVSYWRSEINDANYHTILNNDESISYFISKVLGLRHDNTIKQLSQLIVELRDGFFNEVEWKPILKRIGYERTRIIIYSLDALGYLLEALNVRRVLIGLIEKSNANFLKSRISYYEYISNTFNSEKYIDTLAKRRTKFAVETIKALYAKRIVVLGPAISSSYNEYLIDDEYDVMVLLNYKGGLKSEKSNLIACVYSFYNSKKYFSQNSNYDLSFINSIDLILLKSRGIDYPVLKNQVVEYLDESMKWFLGGPNLLQLLIHNLLLIKPIGIYITGFDIFTSSNYIKGYKGQEQSTSKESFFIEESVHGLLSNFQYLKIVEKIPFLRFDEKIKSILELPENKYLELVQRRFESS